MRRVGVNLESVMEAAETIQSQGENPTIDRVRAFLGDTGSNTTIAKYMQVWRNQIAPINLQTTTHTPPDPVQIAVKRVWQQIREETDAEIATVRSETEKIVNEAKSRVIAADDETKRSKQLADELQQQIYALQAQSEIQKLDFQYLNNDHLILQERYQSLDKRYQDLERVMARQIEDMTLSHQNELTLQAEKSSQQEVIYQKLIAEIKLHAEEQRSQYMQSQDELKTHYKKLQKDLEISESSSASKEIALTELKADIGSLQRERDNLMLQLKSAEQQGVLLAENNALISQVQAELKDIPKMELSYQLIAQMNRIQTDIVELKSQSDSIKAEAALALKLLSRAEVTGE